MELQQESRRIRGHGKSAAVSMQLRGSDWGMALVDSVGGALEVKGVAIGWV
jgi:hypothetical protein